MKHLQETDDLSQWLGMLEKIVDESTNMVVVTDRQRRIKWVNATYTRMTGWSLEDCVGRSPRELLHGPQTNQQDLDRLARMLRDRSSVSNFELLNYKKSGETYHVSINIEPICDRSGEVFAYLSIQSDITERRQMQMQADELKRQLEVAQRLAHLGRIETDPGTGESRWSGEIFRILGMAQDEVPRGFSELMDHALAEEADGVLSVVQAAQRDGNEIDVEFHVRGAHGGCRWVRCRALTCSEGGLPLETPLTWSVQDITLYKSRLEEKRQRNEELNQMVLARTRKLEESNRALEEFSYAISHDLRTPLRHVAGFAELLKEEMSSGSPVTSLAYCDRILHAVGKMQSLIEGMLSFSRLGRAGLRVESVDVGALIADVANSLAGDLGAREVVWHIESGMPVIFGDPVLMREVWVNLLDNALKYSGPRAVSEVEIGARPHRGGWVFFVRDNGVGFDPKHAERLFGMFQRLHRDPRFQGDGVGLALVRRIVETHGGRVWASSRPGEGATFYIFLPEKGGIETGGFEADGRSLHASLDTEAGSPSCI